MRNPAVITLAEVKTSVGMFRVEDSIGDAICFLLGERKIKLTILEFLDLANEIEESIKNLMYHVPGFDLEQISKKFFFQKSDCWYDLKEVKREKVYLNQLLVNTSNSKGRRVFLPIENLKIEKELLENKNKEEKFNNFSFQNHGELIVLFNSENIIVDGQYYAERLYFFEGNKEIEILRMIFKNELHSLGDKKEEGTKRINCLRRRGDILKRIYNFMDRRKERVIDRVLEYQIKFDKWKYNNLRNM